MMSSDSKTFFTPEEYLEFERNVEGKNDYFDGQIIPRDRVNAEHVLIVTNLVYELRSQLKSQSCTTYSSALRVKVGPTGLYTYPDVVVVCGDPQFSDQQADTVTNPTLVVEVLSESTKNYDRGEKFELYRSMNSLKEYVAVAQYKHHIEHIVRRPDNTWVLSETNRIEDKIELTSVSCILKLSEIYDKVDLPAFG